MPQVLLDNIDIYDDYVQSLQDLSYEKTFDKVKLTSNQYILPVLNRDNFFSVNNDSSFFSGSNWLYTLIDIIDDNDEYIFRGSLTKVQRNHSNMTALLTIKDNFFKFRDDIINYESSGWETGAEAYKNICDLVGYTGYNEAAYNSSKILLENNSCKLKCNFNTSSNVTFQNAINKIALYSNATVFLLDNEMYFKVWEYPQAADFFITDDDFKEGIIVQEDESNLYNEYEISYFEDDGTPATDSDNIGLASRNKYGTKSFVLRAGYNSQIILENEDSANYIGKGKIQRTHKNLLTDPAPLSQINFSLFRDFRDRISLDNYIKLNLTREGWTNQIFDVLKYTISQTRDDITIMAMEGAS